MRMFIDVGDYYLIDISTNAVFDKFIDLAQLGRRLGVLKPGEALASEE